MSESAASFYSNLAFYAGFSLRTVGTITVRHNEFWLQTGIFLATRASKVEHVQLYSRK